MKISLCGLAKPLFAACLWWVGTGCSSDATAPVPIEVGDVIALSLAGSGGFQFEPITSSAQCRNPGLAGYQPFDIPTGYKQTIIATQVDDFAPVAGSGGDLVDMLTLNENGPHAGRFLYRTHEVGSNGAVTVTDLSTGETHLAVQQPHYERLDGIAWTPWGTFLFAEEVSNARFPDPDFPQAIRGLVYEHDPQSGETWPRPALGARPHEGIRIDTRGNVYGISETRGQIGTSGQSGAVFKFVPDRRGDLSSGRLYALKVRDSSSKTGPADWVVLDRDAVKIDSDTEAIHVGATGWNRPEDVEIATSTGNARGGAKLLFVAITGENIVLRIELKGDEAFVSNYVEGGVNVVDGQGISDRITAFDDPDNLALDPFGNLFITEDEAPGDIWVALAANGTDRVARSVVLFASLADCAGEPTGIYFDRNGHRLWVQIQHAGGGNDLTIEIEKGDSDPSNGAGGSGADDVAKTRRPLTR